MKYLDREIIIPNKFTKQCGNCGITVFESCGFAVLNEDAKIGNKWEAYCTNCLNEIRNRKGESCQ